MDMFFRKMFGGFDHHSGFGNFDGKDGFDDASLDESMDAFTSVHSFLQEQLNDLLEHFNLDSNFPNDINRPFSNNMIPYKPGTLRELFLKPGFQDSCQAKPNADNDLDERAIQGDLPTFIDEGPNPNNKQSPQRQTSVFSRSIITRTIRQPDGTYVTEKVTRDQDGNEEKTVTVHGDKSEDGGDDLKPYRGPFKFFF
ncbi:uncharacterized protein LOC123306106 [Chrysoperla carnea]|uniref:uncharacterized protein LOC123306106 n=1 Tax=Chrysoperla carnea TaxID=189513 RepID=UPI001D08CB18|nr:uncharacterized protein LOC123306106 [Chrysoperla carnea]